MTKAEIQTELYECITNLPSGNAKQTTESILCIGVTFTKTVVPPDAQLQPMPKLSIQSNPGWCSLSSIELGCSILGGVFKCRWFWSMITWYHIHTLEHTSIPHTYTSVLLGCLPPISLDHTNVWVVIKYTHCDVAQASFKYSKGGLAIDSLNLLLIGVIPSYHTVIVNDILDVG